MKSKLGRITKRAKKEKRKDIIDWFQTTVIPAISFSLLVIIEKNLGNLEKKLSER